MMVMMMMIVTMMTGEAQVAREERVQCSVVMAGEAQVASVHSEEDNDREAQIVSVNSDDHNDALNERLHAN